LLLGGKVTDNIGAFAQVTYDPYATQDANGNFHGHSNADNIDLRYADRFISGTRDLIVGLSANNNPSVSDPWNSAAAWMQYVPVPQPTKQPVHRRQCAVFRAMAPAGNIAGLTAYAYWNKTIYAEFGGYGSSRGLTRFMSAGIDKGGQHPDCGASNPYWRLAYTREWGPHSLMVGHSGMVARVYDDPLDTSDSATVHKFNRPRGRMRSTSTCSTRTQ